MKKEPKEITLIVKLKIDTLLVETVTKDDIDRCLATVPDSDPDTVPSSMPSPILYAATMTSSMPTSMPSPVLLQERRKNDRLY